MNTRRQLLKTGFLAAASAHPRAARALQSRPRTVLLRSSWQTENIGDIAHTPGLLRSMEHYLPEVSVILWPKDLDRGVEPMLRKRFPKLRIVRGGDNWCSPQPHAEDPTIEEAMREASLMINGSGSGLVGQKELERWRATTAKPYGAFGVSVGTVIGVANQQQPSLSDELLDLLHGAAFLFTRETRSLQVVRGARVRCPHVDFAPDASFAMDVRDDVAAQALLQRAGLEPDKYICAIPRLRITPYWDMVAGFKMAPEEVARRKAVNEKHAPSDHAKMREVLTTWVRQTGHKVLLCPEMTYQVGLLRPLLFDPLPDDVQSKVVPMERYWLVDEAASVYRQARAVISMECHSPIIANANGRPGFYLRQPEDTWKGQMYPDLGLGDWKFEIETATGHEIAERLLRVHANYDAALSRVKAAAAGAAGRHKKAMGVVRSVLSAT